MYPRAAHKIRPALVNIFFLLVWTEAFQAPRLFASQTFQQQLFLQVVQQRSHSKSSLRSCDFRQRAELRHHSALSLEGFGGNQRSGARVCIQRRRSLERLALGVEDIFIQANMRRVVECKVSGRGASIKEKKETREKKHTNISGPPRTRTTPYHR